MENKTNLILEVKNLQKHFPIEKSFLGKTLSTLKAVDNVSFKLEKGKTIGVVGESGCGKTTLGRTVLQLYDTTGGKSLYYGHTLYDFMPNYYINDLKSLSANADKLASIVNTLEALKCEELNEYNELLSLNLSFTLNDYNEGLNKLNDLLKRINKKENEVLYSKVSSAVKNISSLINVLNNASCCSGALILGDASKAMSLLIDLVRAKHGYSKYTENEGLANRINILNNELEELKNNIEKCNLFNDLESRIETGLDLARLTKKELRSLRTEIQLIFQDPYSSLPPRMTVGAILSEAVMVHGIVPKDKVKEHIHDIMEKCGLQPQYYDRYPHEFSGGQRQRICIARALAVNPKLVICDEPVSALDVSIQAQIINLLKDLQRELGLTYMFISHDLSVVKYITDSIVVMYLGNMMEIGDTDDIFNNPLHPYTKALFSAVPNPDPDNKMERIMLEGDIPSAANPPKGCKFHTRCKECMSVCQLYAPKHIEYENNHVVACHLYDKEVMADLEKYNLELEEAKRLEAEKIANTPEKTKLQKVLDKILK